MLPHLLSRIAVPLFIAAGVVLASSAKAEPTPPSGQLRLPPKAWQVVKRDSGPVNYYSIIADPARPYIRAQYRPPWETMVLGVAIPEDDRERARTLRWSWRAITLPANGNECGGAADSAAVVYVSWRRTLRWYTIKYVWSSVGPKGATCDGKRNPFLAQDTVILESGGPLNQWKTEEIDLAAEFRKHFASGDPNASVPDFLGLGIMTDGDQSRSESAADYADFTVLW